MDVADVPENTVAATENLQDRRSRAAKVWRKEFGFRVLEANPKTKGSCQNVVLGVQEEVLFVFQMAWNVLESLYFES